MKYVCFAVLVILFLIILYYPEPQPPPHNIQIYLTHQSHHPVTQLQTLTPTHSDESASVTIHNATSSHTSNIIAAPYTPIKN